MAISLVNNLSSIDAQSRVSMNSSKLNSTLQRLSSGLRITNSGDDAAGLAVANSFRSDVAKLRQGIRNANDGFSTLQTIDGGLNTISNLLDRATTLATQSASDTFSGNRTTLNDELTKVTAEITRQASNIKLNTGGDNLKSLSVFIGGGVDASGTTNTVAVDLSAQAVDAAGLAVDALDISTSAGALTAVGAIKAAVDTLGTVQGTVGAGENNLTQAIDLASSQMSNLQAAESRIRDADIASEASDMARLTTLQQAGVAALAQANQSSQAVLSLLR